MRTYSLYTCLRIYSLKQKYLVQNEDEVLLRGTTSVH
jgi:hypothetical protein